MLHKKGIGFGYAFTGLKMAWREEKNFRIHTAIALIVFAAAYVAGLALWEWLFILGAIGAVLTAELLNTSLEELCDMYKTEHDPHIAKIKDIAAAAVFVASTTAAITGVLIFWPHIAALI